LAADTFAARKRGTRDRPVLSPDPTLLTFLALDAAPRREAESLGFAT
jgi:hypothetical protein